MTEETNDDVVVVDAAHRCAVPELGPGESWVCPDPSCGQRYGQVFPPGTEPVNVGFLLHELGEACVEVGHSFAAGVPPRVVQNAFYRLGGQLERAARVFATTDVLLSKEAPHG
ncbi:hypothetical protein BBK82_03195 [Lentzea guizhouensis]|uniref:Uncharacterized protein n=1 Tax=Lentzea guizhouensis TaxID=1586287 RepID=A0A1B2HBY6_9PSEU|nr:hypothetical protein [Lentzea guizhouensis]ANZ35223.1 hypothetical protein BBK82_03195 [Lentzea guizhouensis]